VSDFAQRGEELGKNILENFKSRAQASWDELSPVHKKAFEDAAKDFGKLSLKEIAGDVTARADLPWVKATLANYQAAGAERLRRFFWEAADETVGVAAWFLSGVIKDQLNTRLYPT